MKKIGKFLKENPVVCGVAGSFLVVGIMAAYQFVESHTTVDPKYITQELAQAETQAVVNDPKVVAGYLVEAVKEQDLDKALRGMAIDESILNNSLANLINEAGEFYTEMEIAPAGSYSTYNELAAAELAGEYAANLENLMAQLKEVGEFQVEEICYVDPKQQMEPEKLEKIILDFVNYEYDVLIATSIVESGIDVPNANTIIINNAQQFGLSDLHQLRGRVGRSNRKAFCYLLSPPLSSLTQEARRRLQAIENFSELGSGIHIAMQDLDIRGAGNMLGAEQSGFIADLGYETYQKILEEAVDELKAEEFADLYSNATENRPDTGSEYVRETYIESDLELMFPPTYIPNDSERVSLYRELDKMEEERDILAFTERLKDRFGKVPKEGKELIRVVRLRRMAKTLGMEKVILKKGQMSIFLVTNPESPYYESEAFDKLLGFIQKHPRECTLREQNGKRSIVIKNVPTVEVACNYLDEIGKVQIQK